MPRPQSTTLICRRCRRRLPREMFAVVPGRKDTWTAMDGFCRDCRTHRAQERARRAPFPNPNDPSGATMLVPLTQGQVAVIDAADADAVRPYLWQARRDGETWYAITSVTVGYQRRETVLMHRLILGNPPGDSDHWDGDGLNNRRSNLRPATRSQNVANSGVPKHNTSGFKGVQRTRSGRWHARIRLNSHWHCLGTFDTPEEAARAYDTRAQQEFGDFARLNFPIDDHHD